MQKPAVALVFAWRVSTMPWQRHRMVETRHAKTSATAGFCMARFYHAVPLPRRIAIAWRTDSFAKRLLALLPAGVISPKLQKWRRVRRADVGGAAPARGA